MKPMRNDVTLLAETGRVGPEKHSREPDAPELEGLMRTKPMIPKSIVNGADEARHEQHGRDGGDGKVRRQKPNEHAESGEMVEEVNRGDEPRPVFPKTDGIDPFNQRLARGRRFRRRTGITVLRPIENCLPVSGVCVVAQAFRIMRPPGLKKKENLTAKDA